MEDVMHEIPEAKIPQLLNLPQRLIEADLENLLDICLIVVHMVHLNNEVTSEVPHVSPLLTDITSVRAGYNQCAGSIAGGVESPVVGDGKRKMPILC